MNIHALFLLSSLFMAIAMPLYPDFQLEDPPIMLLANEQSSEIPNPLGLNQYTSPGDANQFSPEPLSPTPASQPQQQNEDGNTPPVAGSTFGEVVCCKLKRGEEKQACRQVVGSFNSICFPDELYTCPNGYKGDLTGCTKGDMDTRKAPDPLTSNPMNLLWLAGICMRKPRPALCPAFFDNFKGFGGR